MNKLMEERESVCVRMYAFMCVRERERHQGKMKTYIPASSSCKHAPIALSEDDRIGYYPQTFRFVFTSSSSKRGLNGQRVSDSDSDSDSFI